MHWLKYMLGFLVAALALLLTGRLLASTALAVWP